MENSFRDDGFPANHAATIAKSSVGRNDTNTGKDDRRPMPFKYAWFIVSARVWGLTPPIIRVEISQWFSRRCLSPWADQVTRIVHPVRVLFFSRDRSQGSAPLHPGLSEVCPSGNAVGNDKRPIGERSMAELALIYPVTVLHAAGDSRAPLE